MGGLLARVACAQLGCFNAPTEVVQSAKASEETLGDAQHMFCNVVVSGEESTERLYVYRKGETTISLKIVRVSAPIVVSTFVNASLCFLAPLSCSSCVELLQR